MRYILNTSSIGAYLSEYAKLKKIVSSLKNSSEIFSSAGVGPAYEVIDLTQETIIESEAPLTRTKRVRSHRSRTIGGGNRKKNKNKVGGRAPTLFRILFYTWNVISEPAAGEKPARPRHPHRSVVGAQGRRRAGEQVRRPLDHQEQLPHRTSGAARREGGECGGVRGGHSTKADHWLGVRDWRVA
jgi:hypothetical protein